MLDGPVAGYARRTAPRVTAPAVLSRHPRETSGRRYDAGPAQPWPDLAADVKTSISKKFFRAGRT